jgi:eukaryotic-like serine/threonine-protein kinase
MPAPLTIAELLTLLRKSDVVPAERLDAFLSSRRERWDQLQSAAQAAALLLKGGLLSRFQARHLLEGRSKGFWIKRYLVLEELGAGGMGRVYLCEQTPMQRLVAVKVLPAQTPPGTLERFLREARASAALDHPNIVRAFDVDNEDRFHFLVMEFVDGPTLDRLVEKQGKLAVASACHYALQAARGLHHAHLAGWIHRDIKPANLVVDRTGTVKVLDLGLARLALASDELTKRYDDQHLMGTADYIAPELTLPDHPVDCRADIYSLGATLYFLLAGRAPYVDGNVLQKLVAHQLSDPPPLGELRPDVPAPLVALIEKMMAKSPAQRIQTAEAVATALEKFARGGPFAPPAAAMPDLCPRVQQLTQAVAAQSPVLVPPAAPEAAPAPKSRQPQKSEAAKSAARRRSRVAIVAATVTGTILLLTGCLCGGAWWGYASWYGNNPNPSPRSAPVPAPEPTPVVAAPQGVMTAEEAAKHLDERCTVQFTVRSAALSKNQKTMFLNSNSNYKSDNNFAVVVHGADSVPGATAAELPNRFQGKTIRVTGLVILYDGRPEVVVSDISHVQIIDTP